MSRSSHVGHRRLSMWLDAHRDPRWEDSREATVALAAFFSVLGLGQLSTLWQVQLLDLPYFVLLASVTIYIAAHKSTTNKSRQQISFKQVRAAPLLAVLSLRSQSCSAPLAGFWGQHDVQ